MGWSKRWIHETFRICPYSRAKKQKIIFVSYFIFKKFITSYFIKCNQVVKDNSGNIVELHCSYDPDTKGGNAPDGRKVKGTIHWVSAEHAFKTEVRLYDRLFNDEKPDSNKHQKDWKDFLNNESKKIIQDVYLEPSLELAKKEEFFQFERLGYFCVDNRDSEKGKPIFNRTVSLRDSWLKQKQKN